MPSTTRSICAISAIATPAAEWITTAASSTSTSFCTATSRPNWSSSGRQGALRIVSLVDRLADGLSSVYTFFDPEVAGASYGTFNILWQIERCRALGLAHLYLGYWIAESRKMSYKATFRPIEGLVEGEWRRLGISK